MRKTEEMKTEDIPETEGAGADGITKLDADEIQDTNERQDADERQDTDLDLEDREYITEGTGSYTDEKGEPCEVRIRLKLEPVEEKAYVDTWTKISGFSMHLEGEVPLQDTHRPRYQVKIFSSKKRKIKMDTVKNGAMGSLVFREAFLKMRRGRQNIPASI